MALKKWEEALEKAWHDLIGKKELGYNNVKLGGTEKEHLEGQKEYELDMLIKEIEGTDEATR